MDSVDISCAVLLGPSNGSLVSQLAARSRLDVSRESLKAPAHVSPDSLRHIDRRPIHAHDADADFDANQRMVDDQLSVTFAALADPTRRGARLANGEATVNELAEPFAISLQAVSKHLKVLERAGLITRGREAQWRPCRLETAPLETASEWIERYREIARDRFDRLDQEIRKIQHNQKGQDHG